MTKKLFILTLIGLISATSVYAKCDGGTEMVGTTFCKSNVTMNWWSATAWCRANGRKLATMYEMCPSWDGNTGNGKCPELSGKGDNFAWSATVSGSEFAFAVNLSSGLVAGYNSDRHYGGDFAFCR